MRKIMILAAFAASVLAGPAAASEAADRTEAIRLCQAQIVANAGAEATVRFDNVRVRLSTIRVEFDVWRDGRLQNVRCDVDRGDQLTVASITPPVQTAQIAP